ncbi:hypothetical protein RI129_012348 [Pyrocoelia pectoralis]|uniref:NADH dehydrogenase [ubiquinone] 1 alpha subcomplex subunit 1 n=1 Tax=Pyrocoelia pectoralis TaxID=417401 RepID=A0AAN7UZ29_9COLE
MWYEIIPSAAVIVVALSLPHISAYGINKLLLGNYYKRSLMERDNRFHYLRDRQLTFSPYKVNGLEVIPD